MIGQHAVDFFGHFPVEAAQVHDQVFHNREAAGTEGLDDNGVVIMELVHV